MKCSDCATHDSTVLPYHKQTHVSAYCCTSDSHMILILYEPSLTPPSFFDVSQTFRILDAKDGKVDGVISLAQQSKPKMAGVDKLLL